MGGYLASEGAYDDALSINPEHHGAPQHRASNILVRFFVICNLAGVEKLLAQ